MRRTLIKVESITRPRLYCSSCRRRFSLSLSLTPRRRYTKVRIDEHSSHASRRYRPGFYIAGRLAGWMAIRRLPLPKYILYAYIAGRMPKWSHEVYE